MVQTLNNLKDVGGLIAKASAAMLADKVQFVKAIDKETDFEGKVNGFNKGATIYVNKPARFTVGTTADITSGIQDIQEEKVAVTLDTQSVIGVNVTSADIATKLSLQSWLKRVADPAMSAIAQSIEGAALTRAKNNVYNSVGTAGSTDFNTLTMLSAREKLMKNLVPFDDKLFALLDSTAMKSAVDNRKGLFQKSDAIAEQYKMGYMGMSDGFTYLENNLLPIHTHGADVAFAVENTVVTIATGMSTLGVDGVTSGATIKAGTTFTIPSCYAVHPITKATQPFLQQFVVTADVTETASNSVILAISPTIYGPTSGSLQNVSALPTDEDACTVIGSASTGYTQNLTFHKSAFRFASVPLPIFDGAHLCNQETVDGITVRVWMDGAVLTDKMIMRFDVLWGLGVVRPEWACKITA